MIDMNGAELYLLGRKLMKIAEEALPSPEGGPPTSVRMILIDVGEHPGGSISEITARTGFPQSHVSTAVARLRELGALETSPDPGDGRRTLVHLAPGLEGRARRASGSIDEAIGRALGTSDADDLEDVKAALEVLATRLIPGVHRSLGPNHAVSSQER